ncbi:unnamed protein product [Periconia digitata]|uniref:Uncharacterized protein n=1 Tax=Periconia digitata TaxID=1303443 RepID=A0A9W4UI46_9PLEO|nr:unnamed protein product [Periconia digitata]
MRAMALLGSMLPNHRDVGSSGGRSVCANANAPTFGHVLFRDHSCTIAWTLRLLERASVWENNPSVAIIVSPPRYLFAKTPTPINPPPTRPQVASEDPDERVGGASNKGSEREGQDFLGCSIELLWRVRTWVGGCGLTLLWVLPCRS